MCINPYPGTTPSGLEEKPHAGRFTKSSKAS